MQLRASLKTRLRRDNHALHSPHFADFDKKKNSARLVSINITSGNNTFASSRLSVLGQMCFAVCVRVEQLHQAPCGQKLCVLLPRSLGRSFIATKSNISGGI